ncbi:hypothetical protein GHT07_10255 [Caenimonas koreensis DSM 17982]|uniref:Uncharacterized protein n=2 Tax=Caenimonas TaxID=763439 RepID=A0A844B7P8_9BURK|nr:hypothetical protein [Caenimonas koreensis DSM 17982]
MNPMDALIHLASFIAPAVAVGALVALAGRLWFSTAGSSGRWWQHTAINSLAGVGALLGGLWYFGVDGKMATYAAMVAAAATSQWVCSKGWKG